MVSRWSSAFTRESVENVLIRLKDVLVGLKWKSRRPFIKMSSKRLPDVVFKTSLRRLKEVFKTSPGRRLEKRSSRLPLQTNLRRL